MIKCVRIVATQVAMQEFVAMVNKVVKRLQIEGALHIVDETTARLVACGSRESIEAFLDALYKQGVALEVEPFLKDKDYRGVFRVIQ